MPECPTCGDSYGNFTGSDGGTHDKALCIESLKKQLKEKKKCDCSVCVYGVQVKRLIERQAFEEDRALLREMYERMCHAEEDAVYWECKYNGRWEYRGVPDETCKDCGSTEHKQCAVCSDCGSPDHGRCP